MFVHIFWSQRSTVHYVQRTIINMLCNHSVFFKYRILETITHFLKIHRNMNLVGTWSHLLISPSDRIWTHKQPCSHSMNYLSLLFYCNSWQHYSCYVSYAYLLMYCLMVLERVHWAFLQRISKRVKELK